MCSSNSSFTTHLPWIFGEVILETRDIKRLQELSNQRSRSLWRIQHRKEGVQIPYLDLPEPERSTILEEKEIVEQSRQHLVPACFDPESSVTPWESSSYTGRLFVYIIT